MYADWSENHASQVGAACKALLANKGCNPQEVLLQRDQYEGSPFFMNTPSSGGWVGAPATSNPHLHSGLCSPRGLPVFTLAELPRDQPRPNGISSQLLLITLWPPEPVRPKALLPWTEESISFRSTGTKALPCSPQREVAEWLLFHTGMLLPFPITDHTGCK